MYRLAIRAKQQQHSRSWVPARRLPAPAKLPCAAFWQRQGLSSRKKQGRQRSAWNGLSVSTCANSPSRRISWRRRYAAAAVLEGHAAGDKKRAAGTLQRIGAQAGTRQISSAISGAALTDAGVLTPEADEPRQRNLQRILGTHPDQTHLEPAEIEEVIIAAAVVEGQPDQRDEDAQKLLRTTASDLPSNVAGRRPFASGLLMLAFCRAHLPTPPLRVHPGTAHHELLGRMGQTYRYPDQQHLRPDQFQQDQVQTGMRRISTRSLRHRAA